VVSQWWRAVSAGVRSVAVCGQSVVVCGQSVVVFGRPVVVCGQSVVVCGERKMPRVRGEWAARCSKHAMGSHGKPWARGRHGVLSGASWPCAMGSHGKPWDGMGSHGKPWEMGSHGGWREHSPTSAPPKRPCFRLQGYRGSCTPAGARGTSVYRSSHL
jgi:hypothetical protein